MWSEFDLMRRRTLAGAGAGLLSLALPAQAGTVRTVKHALGVTRISGSPSRVITLYQGGTDTVVALGAKPIGIVESWVEKPVYRYLRPSLQDVALLGLETQPSLEDIVYLDPDLIVASRFRNERIYGLLSRIAPTIAVEDVFEFRKSTALIGRALGKAEEAAMLLASWDRRIARLKDKLAKVFGTDWPPTVSVLEFRDDHIRSYLPNSFAGSILAELGFRRTPVQSNAFQTLQKLTTRESIPVIDADIFFVFMRSDRPAVQQNYLRWSEHPLWARLKAAQRNQIYQVNNVAWNLSGGILGANIMLDEVARRLGITP